MSEDGVSASDTDRFDLYYGAASGQQRSALRRLDPEAVMISYATANNTPFPGDYDLFIDSGGYHHMAAGTGEYETPPADYLDYLRGVGADLWALRDYPCEPDLLRETGRTVRENQFLTTEAAGELLDAADDVPGQPVAVLQGWTVEQYLDHLDDLLAAGLLTDYIGIGSVCRRNADVDIAEIILAVRERLDRYRPAANLHAFGVKGSVLRFREVADAVDSVDSAAYDWETSHVPTSRPSESFTWRDCARAYLNWRHNTLAKVGTESLRNKWVQGTLNTATDGGNPRSRDTDTHDGGDTTQ